MSRNERQKHEGCSVKVRLPETLGKQEENASDECFRTVIVSREGISYCVDTTNSSIVLSTSKEHQRNDALNLNLGLSSVLPNPSDPDVRKIFKYINDVFLPLESMLFALWLTVPLVIRHWICFTSWALYFPIHRILVGRKTAIHPDASLEYHALTTLLHWGRYFPVSVEKMRFYLSQLSVYHIPSSEVKLTHVRRDDLGVSGVYLHSDFPRNEESLNVESKKDAETKIIHEQEPKERRVIFWIFGGAYLGGDVEGNVGAAECTARECQCDVFIVNYRLLPEHELDDAFQDVWNGYQYLLNEMKIPARNILLYGVSSGGGLALRLMQKLALPKSRSNRKAGESDSCLLPAGAVLMCPFVDYTEQGVHSMVASVEQDLIVNQSVLETGVPYFDLKLGNYKERIEASPVHTCFDGYDNCDDTSPFPPLCVVVSEHECCYQQCILLANRAREAGVDCTLATWKYMCHVFPLLSPFVPEGRQANDFMHAWMNSRFSAGKCN